MKKSIKRITGWVVAICFLIGFIVFKNSAGITPLATVINGSNAQSLGNENNSEENTERSGIDYSNSAVENDVVTNFSSPSNTNSNSQATNSNPTIADLGTNNNQGTILNNDIAYEDTRSSFDEVGSRGGPNVGEQSSNSNATQNQGNAVASNYGGGLSSSGGSSSASSVAAPAATVVTAPGGPGGGGGGGDPFVPIDDYYGLIFLLVTSTLVGVFTLRKVKTV